MNDRKIQFGLKWELIIQRCEERRSNGNISGKKEETKEIDY